MFSKQTEVQLANHHLLEARVTRDEMPNALSAEVHDGFEIGIVLSGQTEGHFGDLAAEFSAGDVWLISPWEAHSGRVTAPGTAQCMVRFLPGFLRDEELDGSSWWLPFSVSPRDRPHVADVDGRSEVMAVAADIACQVTSKRRGWTDALRLGLLRVLLVLVRDWAPAGSHHAEAPTDTSLRRISPALDLVHANPGRRITVAEAANLCAMSKSLFGTLFHQVIGQSFGKYCVGARLARAAQLLVSTGLTGEAIAERTGFVDGSHLHRVFAKHYGCTPADYREGGGRAARGRMATERLVRKLSNRDRADQDRWRSQT